MAKTALDAVCSRQEESGNSSHHKGFSPFMNARKSVGAGIDLPLHFDFSRWRP
jgi:hypothetical protein